MVTKYPDTLTYIQKEYATPERDLDGHLVVTEDGDDTTHTFECRAEVYGLVKEKDTQGGTVTEASWVVYIPVTDFEFKYGQKVSVAGKFSDLPVMRFSRGTFNCRLWV